MTRPWQPAASLPALRARARMLARIRAFFARTDVLEVETPLLAAGANPDPNVESLPPVEVAGAGRLWLQTSPEFAMKRLLAAGSGPIYQIARAFRDNESGRRHNPEFTLLEWYRPGFDHHRLMDEVEALVCEAAGLAAGGFERLSYRDAFLRHADLDPFGTDVAALKGTLQELGVALPEGLGPEDADNRDFWLDLLMGEVVGPSLGAIRPCFVFDYPASQAALARVRHGDTPVAERFELYAKGVELANGFHELDDAAEQRKRFVQDLERRTRRNLPPVDLDQALLAALESGIGDCAGVALGLDRLLMLAHDATHIDQVLAFPADRA